MKKHIIVIGAGFGGLSAAAHMARDGYEVTVLEATDQAGGRARVLRKDGFVFDLGPSWYLMPDVFEAWFATFGHTPNDFYELMPLAPSYRVFTARRTIDIPRAPEVFEVFERIEPGSGARLQQLLTKTAQEYRQVRNGLLSLDGLRPTQSLRPDVLRFLLRPELARSYHGRMKRYVHNPDLQHILEFMTVFLGGSPHTIPAYYSLLAHVDMGMGVWHPKGGFGTVAQAFARVAQDQGATIRYKAAVTRIETQGRQAQAVWVGNERIACDAVVANADYHFVETALLDAHARSYSESYWQQRQMSPSGLIAAIGVDRRLPTLAHHNLFFDVDWERHFTQVFSLQEWSRKPLFYLCAPSRTDPLVAPEGCENLFLVAPVAAGTQPTYTDMQQAIDAMITRIEQATGQAFRSNIVSQTILGPAYFAQTFNAYKGNAFGLSHTFTQSATFRPRLQSKRISNLFYAGQYTNPGTGVPMVIQSGTMVAKLVKQHLV